LFYFILNFAGIISVVLGTCQAAAYTGYQFPGFGAGKKATLHATWEKITCVLHNYFMQTVFTFHAEQ